MTTETAKPRKPTVQQKIEDFAKEGESIFVQNTKDNITVFTRNVNGTVEISEFAAKGSHTGEDVMEIPSTYLKDAEFKKALRKGIFKIVKADNEDVITAFEAQQAAYEAQEQMKNESDRFTEAQSVRSFSGEQCLAQEGRIQCSEYAVYAANNRERPPLCQKHAHLSSQFVSSETGQFKDGKPEISWSRVSILGR